MNLNIKGGFVCLFLVGFLSLISTDVILCPWIPSISKCFGNISKCKPHNDSNSEDSLPANAGDPRDAGLIPGLGRSPEEGNGYQDPGELQPMGLQSQIRLSN